MLIMLVPVIKRKLVLFCCIGTSFYLPITQTQLLTGQLKNIYTQITLVFEKEKTGRNRMKEFTTRLVEKQVTGISS